MVSCFFRAFISVNIISCCFSHTVMTSFRCTIVLLVCTYAWIIGTIRFLVISITNCNNNIWHFYGRRF